VKRFGKLKVLVHPLKTQDELNQELKNLDGVIVLFQGNPYIKIQGKLQYTEQMAKIDWHVRFLVASATHLEYIEIQSGEFFTYLLRDKSKNSEYFDNILTEDEFLS